MKVTQVRLQLNCKMSDELMQMEHSMNVLSLTNYFTRLEDWTQTVLVVEFFSLTAASLTLCLSLTLSVSSCVHRAAELLLQVDVLFLGLKLSAVRRVCDLTRAWTISASPALRSRDARWRREGGHCIKAAADAELSGIKKDTSVKIKRECSHGRQMKWWQWPSQSTSSIQFNSVLFI